MSAPPDVWAIVTARGGSAGLPGKNLCQLSGRPLLHHIVLAAKRSRLVTRAVLTTDSDEIEAAARQIDGLEVRRHDPAMSVVGQPSFHVFRNTVEAMLGGGGTAPRVVALLRATAPLCLASDIDTAIGRLLENEDGATAVVSVVRSDAHPQRLYVMDGKGFLRAREDTPETDYPLPRQGFAPVYLRNGAIYATFPEVVLGGSLWGARPLAYVMPKARSVNINDETDMICAEALIGRSRDDGLAH